MDNSWVVEKPISHRGLFNNEKGVPENSIKAFTLSIENGLAIELDVHLLKDGEIVVFHDDTLERMTDVEGDTTSLSSKDLPGISLLGTDEKIPLFKDVLKLVDGKVPLMIEIKNRATVVGDLEKTLYEMLKAYKGLYAVQSFNPLSVQWFAKNAPEIYRGQLSGDFRSEDDMPFYKKFLLSNMFLNFLSKPDFINYDIRCLPKFSVSIKRKNKPLLSWTITNQEEKAHAEKYCDNYIFESIPVPK